MAERPESEWGRAIKRALDANKEAGKKPDAWHGLARALANQSGGSPSMTSWETTVKRYRRVEPEFLPTEDKALELATALDVERSSLPASSTPTTVAALARRLELFEEKAATLQEVGQWLEPLREAIRRLAKGDNAGALRVLSEAEVR